MADRPLAEIEITKERVRGLLREQAPGLAERSLKLVGRGWDNTNWRLGDDLMVRVPHRKVAAPLIDHEQRWLPVLAPALDLPIPAPVYAGSPSVALSFPWAWSVVPWFPGTEACSTDITDPLGSAELLGRFYAQLHQPAPDDAPANPHRGGPIGDKQALFNERVAELGSRIHVDAGALQAIFAAAADAPAATERVWLHGDLHTRNMVADEGRLSAVIDWGDICSGDSATDLAGAFMLVPDHLAQVRAHAGSDDATWLRARGWAAHFGVLYLIHSDDEPTMYRIGTRLLAALDVDVQ